MGLIYVNPNGPNFKPDPVAAAIDIRETFKRMAMNDEETVALIAGGHSFGKAMAPAMPRWWVPNQKLRPLRRWGSAGRAAMAQGKEKTRITGGPEVTWSTTPTKWSNSFFENLFKYEWELEKSPAGANQFRQKGAARHDSGCLRPVEASYADHAGDGRRFADDPAYEKISPALLRASG